MAQETKRGCGYRKVNGIYLVSGNLWAACDRLPFPISHCPVCSEGLKFPRSPREINPVKLFGNHNPCTEQMIGCHVCFPQDSTAYLLGVGEQFYKTPSIFMEEAHRLGVSKRVKAIPKNFKTGETWIYLVHKKAMFTQDDKPQMGIFAAFKPERIEMPIWKSQLTEEKAKELEKRGITPIPFEDGDPDHA